MQFRIEGVLNTEQYQHYVFKILINYTHVHNSEGRNVTRSFSSFITWTYHSLLFPLLLLPLILHGIWKKWEGALLSNDIFIVEQAVCLKIQQLLFQQHHKISTFQSKKGHAFHFLQNLHNQTARITQRIRKICSFIH